MGEERPANVEEVKSALEFLKKRIEEHGGKLPPEEDVEFYTMIDYVANELGMRFKDIAEELGVNYNTLRTKLVRARRLVGERSGEEGEGKQDVLGPQLTKVVTDKVRHYFGRRVDRVTADMIGLIVDLGIEFFDKHYSWCKENGREPIQCLNEGMLFYRKYRDKVSELESKIADYRNLIVALLSADKEFITKVALVESFKKILEEGIRSGRVRPEIIPDLLKSIERYVSEVVIGG